ncbi:MAG: hypothetical protein AAF708_00530 [Deinococcota bacterium]
MRRYFLFTLLLLFMTACGPSRADMQALQTRLDETSGRLTATQDQLAAIQGQSGQAEQQISELEQEVAQLTQENSMLQTELDEARATQAEQQAEMSSVTEIAENESGEVAELRRELANRPSQAEVDLLAAQLRLLEENIASLESSE